MQATNSNFFQKPCAGQTKHICGPNTVLREPVNNLFQNVLALKNSGLTAEITWKYKPSEDFYFSAQIFAQNVPEGFLRILWGSESESSPLQINSNSSFFKKMYVWYCLIPNLKILSIISEYKCFSQKKQTETYTLSLLHKSGMENEKCNRSWNNWHLAKQFRKGTFCWESRFHRPVTWAIYEQDEEIQIVKKKTSRVKGSSHHMTNGC